MGGVGHRVLVLKGLLPDDEVDAIGSPVLDPRVVPAVADAEVGVLRGGDEVLRERELSAADGEREAAGGLGAEPGEAGGGVGLAARGGGDEGSAGVDDAGARAVGGRAVGDGGNGDVPVGADRGGARLGRR